MNTGPIQDGLLPSEFLVEASGVPAIAYVRAGLPGSPTIVALPGGGHMARVFYGHPDSRAEDFLDYWLEKSGLGFIALSYPSDHRAFRRHLPDLTVTDWGNAAALMTAEIMKGRGLYGSITPIGWSMAGRACRAFNVAARRLGLKMPGFIALAATPPMPGMVRAEPEGEPFTAEGFWRTGSDDTGLTARNESFLRDINWRETEIISAAAYKAHYIVNTPIRLRGEPNQRADLERNSLLDTIADLGTFAYPEYPFTGVIAPTRTSDARHALTDQATWGFLNSQKLFCEYSAANSISSQAGAWNELRELALQLPSRLCRYVEGGHFFFIGREGAEKSALHVAELCKQLEYLEVMMVQLLNQQCNPGR
ncbi:hypothetical protein [Bradyrhizobium iriomotense]|uniref:Alpha/beta hydrolase n=1 Tax=Bradyrhizobium iriomotense TaxID=441950 RepID=A0ABQ6B9E5_9BRAD|nr:hypothetical protein [Bradyrhizobium iriomotense]GLR90999.1 hypothetical protein GCM10007857_77150 [Bradyrhizobium iriomotense]